MVLETDLAIPEGAGKAIVETGAMIACPLLCTDQFVAYCRKRGLRVTRERLVRLERLRVFAPVFRVGAAAEKQGLLKVPREGGDCWFAKGWAQDTTAVSGTYPVPEFTDLSSEAYYSIFQIHHLDRVLSVFTRPLELDFYVNGDDSTPIDWTKAGARWIKALVTTVLRRWQLVQFCSQRIATVQRLLVATDSVEGLRTAQHSRAVALLCQHVSNRYYPYARSDMRTFRHGATSYSDKWITVDGHGWDRKSAMRQWDAREVEEFYELTPEKLRLAFEGLAIAQARRDPIKHWYELVQFTSVGERDRLQDEALKAETLRGAAYMLRAFYKELYGVELQHPNEVTGLVQRSQQELDVRRDVRRHLEFVANRFGVNPQPRLSLIVEGRSEEVAVTRIFEKRLGAHPGVFGIEIVDVSGVNNATGGRGGRYAAIMRLIDYLHHHQTFAILVLDNERDAKKLKARAEQMKSIHNSRFVTRPEYVNIWEMTFEFDNFSDSEISAALDDLADEAGKFAPAEVSVARKDETPGAALKSLFRDRTASGLDKVRLSELLTDNMLSAEPCDAGNRPIMRIVKQAAKLAALNHLPTTKDASDKNQGSSYFGTAL